MKKICLVMIITILCATFASCSAQVNANTISTHNEWTGSIRIEGKDDTVWSGTVTVSDTYFYAKNSDTGETQEYYISYPSVLGALIEASDIAGFSYIIEYWPSWNGFLVKTIHENSDWWHYWVDYKLPIVGAVDYELTNQDTEILWGYLESWYSHALRISVDKNSVRRNEKFTVRVFNETMIGVEGATVYVGTNTYTTDSQGNVTIQLSQRGWYSIYAEKEEFVRSEKVPMQVRLSLSTQPVNIFLRFFENLIQHLPVFNWFLQPFLPFL